MSSRSTSSSPVIVEASSSNLANGGSSSRIFPDADASCQSSWGNCLYVEITLIRRTDEAASRTAHVDSSAAPLYGGSGRTDDHEINVALARLGANAMLSPRTRNVATASLGFDMLLDDLQIQISDVDLGLQPLRYIRCPDVAPVRRRCYWPSRTPHLKANSRSMVTSILTARLRSTTWLRLRRARANATRLCGY